jgi:hypothetical protein
VRVLAARPCFVCSDGSFCWPVAIIGVKQSTPAFRACGLPLPFISWVVPLFKIANSFSTFRPIRSQVPHLFAPANFRHHAVSKNQEVRFSKGI